MCAPLRVQSLHGLSGTVGMSRCALLRGARRKFLLSFASYLFFGCLPASRSLCPIGAPGEWRYISSAGGLFFSFILHVKTGTRALAEGWYRSRCCSLVPTSTSGDKT